MPLPIVLAHGYLGFGALGPLSYFNNVGQILAQMGAKEVHATDVLPKGSISQRASELAAQIRQYVPNGKVHVIAHSMGGLDARFLIGNGQGREMIATLTALGTPFRGTLAADVAANPSQLTRVGAARMLEAIVRYQAQMAIRWPFAASDQTHFAVAELREAVGHLATGDYSHVVSYFSGLFSLDDAALGELTTENCQLMFPEDEHDLAGIPSFSYAGSIEAAGATPFLSVPAILLDASGEPNDALVPVSSAKLRNHRQTLAVDHIGLVGWTPADVSGCYRQIYSFLSAH
jgi:pimeloyl-ACP methyl ester carboxylesterase